MQKFLTDQKRKLKHRTDIDWGRLEREEMGKLRSPEFYKRYLEAVTTAERVLLYTTGFQFDVKTAFHALFAIKAHLQRHPDSAVHNFFTDKNVSVCITQILFVVQIIFRVITYYKNLIYARAICTPSYLTL